MKFLIDITQTQQLSIKNNVEWYTNDQIHNFVKDMQYLITQEMRKVSEIWY